jgi:hypothetical protein
MAPPMDNDNKTGGSDQLPILITFVIFLAIAAAWIFLFFGILQPLLTPQ